MKNNKQKDFIITPGVIEEVKDLIKQLNKQTKTGIIDYYELFRVLPTIPAENLKNSVDIQRLTFILQDRNAPIYGLDAVELAQYKKLVNALNDFKTRVLVSENNKKSYDAVLAESKRARELKETSTDFAYVPQSLEVDTERKFTAAESALYKLAEASIVLQGTSKTVLLLANLLVDKTKTTIPTELRDIVDALPIGAITSELVKKHGKKGVVTIVCEELDELFSRKTTVLTEALELTDKKYNREQAKLALKLLIEQGLPLAFHRHKDATKGRDKVTMEIKPNMVKYVIAAYMAEDKDLRAMDDPTIMAKMYLTDEELNEILDTMLPEKKLFEGFKGFRGFGK